MQYKTIPHKVGIYTEIIFYREQECKEYTQKDNSYQVLVLLCIRTCHFNSFKFSGHLIDTSAGVQ